MRAFIIGLLILCLCPSLALADSVTLDFSSGTIDAANFNSVFSYTEKGINVTTYGTPYYFGNYFFLSNGHLVQTSAVGIGVVFTAANGASFDVLSVDLLGGPTIFLSSSGAGLLTTSGGLLTFPSLGWTDITSLTLLNGISVPAPLCCRTGIHLDNLTVNVQSVPEPSTLLFLGVGLAILAAWRWKQRAY